MCPEKGERCEIISLVREKIRFNGFLHRSRLNQERVHENNQQSNTHPIRSIGSDCNSSDYGHERIPLGSGICGWRLRPDRAGTGVESRRRRHRAQGHATAHPPIRTPMARTLSTPNGPQTAPCTPPTCPQATTRSRRPRPLKDTTRRPTRRSPVKAPEDPTPTNEPDYTRVEGSATPPISLIMVGQKTQAPTPTPSQPSGIQSGGHKRPDLADAVTPNNTV